MAKLLDPNIIPTAKEKLDSGKTKQETFEELIAEFDEDPEKIAKMIRFIPTKEKRRKYFPLILTTVIILIGLTGFETVLFIKSGNQINTQFTISTALTIFLVSGMLKSNALFCSGVGFFGAARAVVVCLNVFRGGAPLEGVLLIELVVGIAMFILGFYLRTKLDSRYTVERDSGIIDSIKGIQFPD